MRLSMIPLALVLVLTGQAFALDAGQRPSNARDPDANYRGLVTKRMDVGDGPGGLVLGAKPLTDFLPSVTAGGDMMLLPNRKIGRVQDGKYIATSDSMEVAGQATIGGRLDINAPTQFHSMKGAYWSQVGRGLYTSDTSNPINWLGNGASGSATNYGYGGFAQGVFLSGLGDVGISAATRTDMITTPGRFPAAANFQAFNFNTATPITAWGIYGEARRKKGAGQIHGGEVNVTDLGDGSDRIVPSAMKSGPNAVYGAWSSGFNIACGGNVTKRTLADGTVVQQQTGWDGAQEIMQAANCGVALPIYANGAKFEKALIIGENALVGCDGTGFPNVCNGTEFGRGTRLTWIDGSTRLGATIDSNVSPSGNAQRMMFTDFGVTFDGYGGATFNVVAKSTDVTGVQVIGGPSAGAPARLVAVGAPNANLGLSASGTGVVQIQSPLNAPNLATSGGTVKGTLCVDTAGAIYVKTTAGACL